MDKCCTKIFYVVFVVTLTMVNFIANAKLPRIFVSVAPQKLLIQRLAGVSAQIEILLQPGQDPHTFEPSSRIITKLANADVYFSIGVPFEMAWMRRIKAVNPQMNIVNGSDNEDLKFIDEHVNEFSNEHAHEHNHDVDPHTWTSPVLVKAMSLQWRDYLIGYDPENKDVYLQNYVALSTELDALDVEIKAMLAPISKSCHFMVYHPAWGHFANAYNLIQISVEQNGKSPGAKTFVSLVNQAKALKLKTVFVQPQFDRKTVQTLADAIDAQVEILDPLVEDYFGNLRQVASKIARSCTK